MTLEGITDLKWLATDYYVLLKITSIKTFVRTNMHVNQLDLNHFYSLSLN